MTLMTRLTARSDGVPSGCATIGHVGLRGSWNRRMVLQHRSSLGPSIGNLRCCPRPPVRPQSNDIILLFAAVILNLEAWFIGRYPYWSLHYWGEPYVPPDTLTIILTHVLATGFIVFSRFVEIEQSRTKARPTQQPHMGMDLHSTVLFEPEFVPFIQHCCVSGPVAGGDPSICGG